MMSRICALGVLTVLLLGCSSGPADPADGQNAKSDDASEADASSGPIIAGKALAYWVDQAKTSDPTDDIDAIVEALTAAMESEEHAVMVRAADALEQIGPEAEPAAVILASKLDHIQPWVRCAAMDALVTIGRKAVPALVDTIENGPGNAPIRAAITLGNIGPDAQEAIPALEAAMNGPMAGRKERLEQIAVLIDPTRAGPQPDAPAAGSAVIPTLPGDAPIVPVVGNGDWAQFHGPGRDSLCSETSLLHKWPADGPELLWALPGLGRGYSTVSIADGKLVTMGDRPAEGEDRTQYVIAFDLKTRAELWATRIGPPHDDGPRCTPTIDGSAVYAIGTGGDLLCLELAGGEVRWRKNFESDFGGRMMSGWKYCESPLVDGDQVVCTPGGPEGAIVALDKQTGELLWRTVLPEFGPHGKNGAAYSSIVPARIGGIRQYVQLLGRGVVGVDAATGRFLWGYSRIANATANITTPVVRGNLVFVTTSYNTGSALLRIARDGDTFMAEEVYFLDARTFQNQHGGVVLVGNHIYGGHGQNRGHPVCLDLATGKTVWQEKAIDRGSAAVLYADGHLIFRYDRGTVALIEATPDEFRLKGMFQSPAETGPAWAHPVIHDGKLYLRDNDTLYCYDVRASNG